MKHFLIIALVINLFIINVNGQQLHNSSNFNIDLKSNLYVRIFDGFQLKDAELPPQITINKIITTKDSVRLKKLGVDKIIRKPYMILSSNVSAIRRFIYAKAKVNNYYEGINFPIILNGELITFEKYDKLEKIDTNKILKISFLKTAPKSIKDSGLLPFGVISVTLIN